MTDRDLSDYVEVAERIQEFRTAYPSGSLRGDWRMELVGDQTIVAYRAEAWRAPDDQAPGIGCAWELVPGRTPFTRGSELQNAETSAWGRAIIAVGAADAKRGIASREEVRAQRERVKIPGPEHERLRHGTVERTPDDKPAQRSTSVDNSGDDPWTGQPPGAFDIGQPEDRPGSIDSRQEKLMHQAFNRLGITDRSVRLGLTAEILGREVMTSKQLSKLEADFLIKALNKRLETTGD